MGIVNSRGQSCESSKLHRASLLNKRQRGFSMAVVSTYHNSVTQFLFPCVAAWFLIGVSTISGIESKRSYTVTQLRSCIRCICAVTLESNTYFYIIIYNILYIIIYYRYSLEMKLRRRQMKLRNCVTA